MIGSILDQSPDRMPRRKPRYVVEVRHLRRIDGRPRIVWEEIQGRSKKNAAEQLAADVLASDPEAVVRVREVTP